MARDAAEVLSVSAFTERVREALETELPEVWVRGEVSNLRRQASGHVYFSLKDAGAQVSVVCFRGNAMRIGSKLRDGAQLVLYGEVSVYAPRGNYQIIARHVLEDGLGQLRQRFEALKEKLSAEGLFAPERKRPIPRLPHTVGIVTSPTGAALRDFISILRRRGWGGRLVVLPARVQGQGAAEEIAARIGEACRIERLELLVVGRGGGSLEDLWPFNEEAVARAVAGCSLPVISAVGHETDFTLSDFAADLRAETPSAAAEYISSDFIALRDRLLQASERFHDAAAWELERRQNQLILLRETLARYSPQARVEHGWLRLDELMGRLHASTREALHTRRNQLAEVGQALLRHEPRHRYALASQQVAHLRQRLENASLQKALDRGFAIARDAQGQVITRKAQLQEGQKLALDFADGETRVRVEEK